MFAKIATNMKAEDVAIAMDLNTNDNSIDCSPKNQKCLKLRRDCDQFWRTRYHLVIIIMFGIVGFCWHLSQSVSEYWAYKTKVTFTAEEPHDYKYEYPGVTICYKDLAPFDKLKKKYPEFGKDVDRIEEEMRLRNDFNLFSKPDSKNLTSANVRGNQLQKYYEKQLMNQSTILDILENWSFGEPGKCQLDSFPITDGRGEIKDCIQISSVLESINADFRCFTYFSQFLKANKSDQLFTTTIFKTSNNYEDRDNKIAYIGFSKPSNTWNPFEQQLRARIAIHPSNMIPNFRDYPNEVLFEWGKFYPVIYGKTVSYLLEPPYETNCRYYNIRDQNDSQSYDDCFTKCVINIYRQNCKCLPRSSLLYRKNLLEDNDKFCPSDNECKSINTHSICANSCKTDCISEQYEFEILADIPWHNYLNSSGVDISRKPVLDRVYRHSPGITWIQLVSDFGGLGGMWLGMSVISLSKTFICWINRSFTNNKINGRS